MNTRCKCRERMAGILRKRLKELEERVVLADQSGCLADGLELRARRNEAQLMLNTVLLEDF